MIGMDIKKLFFNTKAVTSAVDRATRKVLSRFGAFVRTRAKSSIRKRKKASQPGKPPHSHTGLLRRLIYFGYSPSRQSVVVGPEKLNKSGNVPRVLEHSGTTTIVDGGKKRRVRIKARPFMGPAMIKELPKSQTTRASSKLLSATSSWEMLSCSSKNLNQRPPVNP